ncbi:MAG: hypothetical protein ABW101_09295 [Candidatus Thiodiazotropha sp.]
MTGKNRISDRLALGFLNLLVGLPTGALLWVVLNGFPWAASAWLPASFIFWFTGVMVVLGILMQEVLFLGIYSRCWNFLMYWFKGGW